MKAQTNVSNLPSVPVRAFPLNNRRSGFIWLMLVFIMAVAFSVGLLNQPASKTWALQRTQASLAQARLALLAYASQPLAQTNCEQNCPRPGDLPCPDNNNDGVAESSCTATTSRLGRFPWKTLGTGDLRDAADERLWYAVSDTYKSNPRKLPLNLDTPGSLNLKNSDGLTMADAVAGSGLVAIVLAPLWPLKRNDGLQQLRQSTTQLQASHYLDVWQTEDNANFIDANSDGFVLAPTSAGFNDVGLGISATVIHKVMQQRVLAELKPLFSCSSAPCSVLPKPASIDDAGCLGAASLTPGSCLVSAQTVGRLPLDSLGSWPLGNTTHVLDGGIRHHWFQQNGWREQVMYRPLPTAVTRVVSGERLATQSRSLPADKLLWTAYLESSTLQILALPTSQAVTGVNNDSVAEWKRP